MNDLTWDETDLMLKMLHYEINDIQCRFPKKEQAAELEAAIRPARHLCAMVHERRIKLNQASYKK